MVVYLFKQSVEQRAGVLPATCRWPRTLAEQAGTFVEDEYEANGTSSLFKHDAQKHLFFLDKLNFAETSAVLAAAAAIKYCRHLAAGRDLGPQTLPSEPLS